jgi:hypothetical protein
MIAKRMNPTRRLLRNPRMRRCGQFWEDRKEPSAGLMGLRGPHLPRKPWRYGQAWRHSEGGRKLAQPRGRVPRGFTWGIHGRSERHSSRPLGKEGVIVGNMGRSNKESEGVGRRWIWCQLPGDQDRVPGAIKAFGIEFIDALPPG